jgi:hypothetical protein
MMVRSRITMTKSPPPGVEPPCCTTEVPDSIPLYPFTVVRLARQAERAAPNSVVETEAGLWVFGSKGTVFAKSPVADRIEAAVTGTYGSRQALVERAQALLVRRGMVSPTLVVTLHFEAIPAEPSPELTVSEPSVLDQ